jgi:hypothetical protein
MKTMRPALTGLLASLAGVVLAAPAAGQTLIQPTPYFPLDKGNTWQYRAGKEKITMRVARHEVVANVTCAVIEATDGKTTREEHVTSLKEGVYRYKADKEIKPPLLLLKLPLKPGESWEVDSEADGLKVKGKFTVSEEEITVLDKKVKAAKVHSDDFQIGDRFMELTYWYVPRIGPARQRIRVAGFERVLELEKYTVAE